MRDCSAALVMFAFLSTGCASNMREVAIPSPTPSMVTATLQPTMTPPPTGTYLPPPPQPTVAPVEGTTSTQVNVRLEPSTAGNVLGIIPANTKVEITGKDPGGNWWQINYPQAEDVDGKGWVTAQYVTTAAKPDVPTIGGNGVDPSQGNAAIVLQQLNVRSGPGTGFNSLGTLNPQDVVALTGKDPNGAWLQIDFSAGPEGKGWVNAAFVQAKGAENLPIITEAGLIVGTGTPTGIPATPTVTLLPAVEDGDSAQSPSVNVIFSSSGTRDLQYSSDVSSPTGDAEDWLQFTPYTADILLEVSCKGNNLHIELFQTGQVVPQAARLACGSRQIVPVQPGRPVQVHVSMTPDGSLNYSTYTLNIKTLP
jgi:uncharacterized protein YraI